MPETKEISTNLNNITEAIRLEGEDLTPVEEQSLKDCLEVYRRNHNH